MSDYEINVPIPAPYKLRLRANLRIPLIMTAVFALVAIGFTTLMKTVFLRFFVVLLDAIIFVLAIILQIKWASKEEIYFITHLKLSPDKVEISYAEKDDLHIISGKPDEFIFKKKEVLGRTGSSYQQSYLEVYHKGKLIVRQYIDEGWSDLKFIEIVHAANY